MSDASHLSDDQLVSALDGELAPADAERVGNHITACWTCRTRRGELAAAMSDFVQARDVVLFPRIPPPTSWHGLRPRLLQMDGQPVSARELWARIRSLLDIRLSLLTPWRAAVAGAAVFAVVLVLVQSLSERPLAAAEVLARARPVERLDGHRQLTIEERDGPSGRLLRRRRVDVWQNGARRVTARRLFDEQGRLVAGEWTRPDGLRTVLVRGQRPHIERAGTDIPIVPSSAWRLSPGAGAFAAVTDRADVAISEDADNYTVSASLAGAPGATIALTVRKADMHPIAHTLTWGATIVSTVETAFDEASAASMPASAFEPDGELLETRLSGTGAARPRAVAPSFPASSRQSVLDLEADALLRLDSIGGLLGEQVSSSRSPDGVVITARTETAARRDQLLAALAPLAGRRGVRVDVRTFADADESVDSVTSTSIQVVEIVGTYAPVYDDLRAFFLDRAANSPPEANGIDEQIQEITRIVLEHSLEARRHARALVQLTARISQGDLQLLDTERVNRWWAAIGEHARIVEQQARALRNTIEPVFYRSTAVDNIVVDTTLSTSVWAEAPRLAMRAATVDADLAQAFSRSAQVPAAPLAVGSPRFHEALIDAEALATRIRASASSR